MHEPPAPLPHVTSRYPCFSLCLKGYFGEKVALYSAWLGYTTFALIIPTLIGWSKQIHALWVLVQAHLLSTERYRAPAHSTPLHFPPRLATPLYPTPLLSHHTTSYLSCAYCCSSSSHGQKHSRQILSGGWSDWTAYSTNPSMEYTVEYSTESLTYNSTEYRVDTATSFSSSSSGSGSGSSSSGLFSGMTSSEMYQVNA